jgi:biotin operon repressor
MNQRLDKYQRERELHDHHVNQLQDHKIQSHKEKEGHFMLINFQALISIVDSARSNLERDNTMISSGSQSNQDLFQTIADLSTAQQRILNYLIYTAQRVPTLYMSQDHIAKVAGCCRQWANECIQKLKDLGLIFSERRRYFYGWRTNIYGLRINFFKDSIRRELYTLLSSLRISYGSRFSKKTTQLENEQDINNKSILSRVSTEPEMKEKLTPQADPPDPMTMSWDILRQLAELAHKKELQPRRQESVDWKPKNIGNILKGIK